MSHRTDVPIHSKRKSTRHSDSEPEGPTTTLSGVAPGRALYDTPSPSSQAPALERHQRSRKATTRKLEWIESQSAPKNSKPRRPAPSASARKHRTIQSPDATDDENGGAIAGQARNAGTAETTTNPGPPASDTQMAAVGPPNPVQFFSKEGILYALKESIGHDVTHLSTRELEELANSISQTQTAALELKKWNTPALVQPATSMGVGGGYYRDRIGEPVVSKPSSQPPYAVTNPSPPSRKRPSSPSSRPPPKRPHLNDDNNNTNGGDDIDELDEDEEDPHDDDDDDGNGGRGDDRRGYRGSNRGDSDNEGDEEEDDDDDDDDDKSKRGSTNLSRNIPSVNPPAPDPSPSLRTHVADLLPSANGPALRGAQDASQTNFTRPPGPRVDNAAENSATVSETEHSPTVSEFSETTPTRRLATTARVSTPSPWDNDIPRPSRRSPDWSRDAWAPIPSSAPRNTNPLQPSQADYSRVLELPSPIRQLDMGEIIQWALKVAEDRVREQQALAKSSIKTVLRSRLRQDPPAGDGEPSRWNSERSAGPESSAARTQVLSDDDCFEKDAVALAATAIAKGKPRRPRKKPGLGDFNRVCQQLAKSIKPSFLVKSITTDSYASVDQNCEWLEDLFRQAWIHEFPGIPLELPDREYFKVVSRRAGLERTTITAALRHPMETAYGFTKLVRTSEQAQTNRRLSRKLGSINFYCRDTKTGDDPYENPTISTAITTAYFSDTKALGVKFPKSFNPIPLPAVALVLTLMQFTISEWTSGWHEKLELDCEAQRPIFDTHLKGLEKYAAMVPDRMVRFRKAWFQNGMDSVAGSNKSQPGQSQPIFRADRVRPPTPPVDRAGTGQSSSQSKGKKPVKH